jgi:hypothetical protein
MKKILFAFITVLALAGTAEARNLAHHEVENYDPLESILGPQNGNGNWAVSPRIRGPIRHASRYHTYAHHYAGKPSSSIVAYGRMLQASGLRVSEHPAFGGVHHVHHGWAHYAGRAIDINIGRGVNEASGRATRARFDAVAARARAAGYTVLWRVAGHFNHIHIQR